MKKLYQVKELSELAGISVRTLHHYDEVGLLKAKRHHTNEYRYYTLDDAVLLQQIVFYKKLGFSLKDIMRLTTASSSVMDMLSQQHAALLQRQQETQSIIEHLEMAMSALRGEKNLEVLFTSMPEDKSEKWRKALLDSKNGESIKQVFSEFSESEVKTKEAQADDWCKRYVAVLSQPIEHESVQALVGEAYVIALKGILDIDPSLVGKFADGEGYRTFLELSRENNTLEEMYEFYSEGFSKHFFDASMYFCENQLADDPEGWRAKLQ